MASSKGRSDYQTLLVPRLAPRIENLVMSPGAVPPSPDNYVVVAMSAPAALAGQVFGDMKEMLSELVLQPEMHPAEAVSLGLDLAAAQSGQLDATDLNIAAAHFESDQVHLFAMGNAGIGVEHEPPGPEWRPSNTWRIDALTSADRVAARWIEDHDLDEKRRQARESGVLNITPGTSAYPLFARPTPGGVPIGLNNAPGKLVTSVFSEALTTNRHTLNRMTLEVPSNESAQRWGTQQQEFTFQPRPTGRKHN